MKYKLFIIIAIMCILMQISIVSASTEHNNDTNTVTKNVESSQIEDVYVASGDNLNYENSNYEIKEKGDKKNYYLNKEYSNNTKSNPSNWTFKIDAPKTAKAKTPLNISIEILSDETINKGSFNYYFDNIYIGNSPIKKNRSNLTYTIPKNYEGSYFMEFRYVDENNHETIINDFHEINVYTNETIIIDSNLPENFPLYVSNTIELYLKDGDGKIVKKSGYVDFSISYPTFQIRGFEYEESYIGRYKVINGLCKFNFTLTEDYPWSDETIYFNVHFKFKYINPNNNKTYTLTHTTTPMYGDEIFMDDTLPSRISSGETINIQFVGLNNYEDSKLLIYANNKYIGSTEFTDHEHYTISFEYKIPEDFVGNLNIFAKRITKTGFNTSCRYSYNISVLKSTKINGRNISSNAGKKITFKGNVTDIGGKPIKTGRVVIKLNGKTIKSDIYLNKTNNFTYNYKIPENFTSKKYTITYIYIGNNKYARSEQDLTLSITKKITRIDTNNVSCFAGQKILLKGKLIDDKNKPITTGKIAIKLNGKTITSNVTPNKKGEFNYAYKIPDYTAKKYKITYVYIENQQYTRTETNKTLTIKTQTSKITANNITNYQNNTTQLTIKITGTKTNNKATTGNVTIKINGKKYIKKITNGTTTLKYKIPPTLKAGQYKITITYTGGRNLLQSNTTTTLTVKDHTTKIQSKNIKTQKGKTIKITATINDSIGKIKTGNTTFKLNNKTIGTSKITNGTSTITYSIPQNYQGNYTLQILAQGKYTDLNKITRTLTVV